MSSHPIMAFPGQRRGSLRCRCCREVKPAKNGDQRCDSCVVAKCELQPWDDYKRGEGCPHRAKRRQMSGRRGGRSGKDASR